MPPPRERREPRPQPIMREGERSVRFRSGLKKLLIALAAIDVWLLTAPRPSIPPPAHHVDQKRDDVDHPTKETRLPPEKDTALPSEQAEALKKAVAALNALIPTLSDPEERARIKMLDPHQPIRAVCRFTSDWFQDQHGNLSVLWAYLSAREAGWPEQIDRQLEKAVALGRPFGPETVDALKSVLADKLRQSPQRAKCGMLLGLVPDATKTDGQEIGARILVEALKQIAEDVRAAGENAEKLSRLAPVVEAATAAIAGARKSE